MLGDKQQSVVGLLCCQRPTVRMSVFLDHPDTEMGSTNSFVYKL